MSDRSVPLDRVCAWLPWAAVAVAAGVAAVAGSYVAVGRHPAFVGTPFDAFVRAVSPPGLMSFARAELGDLAHQLALATALGLAALLLGLAALAAILALRDGRPAVAIVLAVAIPGVATAAVTLSPASGLGAGLGAGIVVGTVAVLTRLDGPGTGDETSGARRRVLGALGAAAGLGALGLFLRGGDESSTPVEIPDDARPTVRERLTQAREADMGVAGMEPMVSADFYEVDINSVSNPDVDADDWSLSITGAVENEVEVDVADLREMPLEDRFVTLRCVGDYLNGDKMDNALWSGVPVADLLARANPTGDRVTLRAVDGFFNEFPLAALEPGLLAYRMNGRPLPRAHGAPVRALVPGHWGEVCVKWIDEIEVSTEDSLGYWETRGWHGTGPVHTVAKLWADNHLGGGRIEVAGYAYAGTRGIERVEVSTNGGESWTDAELSEPLPGDDVWRQWRHEFDADGPREVVVRAVDGNGDVQIPEQAGPQPDGATGWVSKTVRPR